MSKAGRPLRLLLLTGEPSGDVLAARVVNRLASRVARGRGAAARFSHVECHGLGGAALAKEGLASLFPLKDISVMGLFEILPALPRLLVRRRQTIDLVRRLTEVRAVDAVLSVDAKGFVFPVLRSAAKETRAAGVPVLHAVVPSIWAYRRSSIAGSAPYGFHLFLDHLFCILPFEPDWFRDAGVPCTYVGHPAVELVDEWRTRAARRLALTRGDDASAASGDEDDESSGDETETAETIDEVELLHEFYGGDAADIDTTVGLLPGSRVMELKFALPLMKQVAEQMTAERGGGVAFVLPASSAVVGEVDAHVATWKARVRIVSDEPDAKYAALTLCDAALVVSGTASLECALLGVPQVCIYDGHPVTAFLARRMARVRHVCITNIMADRAIIPELIFRPACTADNAKNEIERLLVHGGVIGKRQLADLKPIVDQLRVTPPFADRMADAVLSKVVTKEVNAVRPGP